MKGWVNNLQASYQTFALQELVGERVNGILVQVIEKPKFHIPKRKCKSCETQYEFSSWIPKGEMYCCPICGNEQKLQPLKEAPTRTPPFYFRMVVERSEEQLAKHKEIIQSVTNQMKRLRNKEEEFTPPTLELNLERCVEPAYHRTCQYFDNHSYNIPTSDDPTMMEVEDYVQEETTNEGVE
jgi:hypothetical protein